VESGAAVAGIELVEQAIEAHQSLVGILRGEVHTVIVIPQRTQGLVDVTVGLMGGVESGEHVRVVLVAEVARRVEVARIAVALRRVVGVVQVSGDRGHAEPGVVHLRDRWQGVDITRELRLAVKRLVRRAGAAWTCAVVETPDGLRGQRGIVGLPRRELPLVELVESARNDREA